MKMKLFAACACALALAACGDNAPNPDELRGANFAADMGGTQITLTFDENEMQAGGQIVNLYHGPYVVDGNKMQFGEMATTMMMGPEQAMLAEQEYLQFLATVETYDLKNGQLILRNGDGKEFVFTEIEAPATDDADVADDAAAESDATDGGDAQNAADAETVVESEVVADTAE